MIRVSSQEGVEGRPVGLGLGPYSSMLAWHAQGLGGGASQTPHRLIWSHLMEKVKHKKQG